MVFHVLLRRIFIPLSLNGMFYGYLLNLIALCCHLNQLRPCWSLLPSGKVEHWIIQLLLNYLLLISILDKCFFITCVPLGQFPQTVNAFFKVIFTSFINSLLGSFSYFHLKVEVYINVYSKVFSILCPLIAISKFRDNKFILVGET